MLAVSVADCVPIFLVAPARPAVALLHGGWRGVAAGILERGLALLRDSAGAVADDVHVHFGPAICGACYEVGADTAGALGLDDTGDAAAGRLHVDLRAALAHRARNAGVPAERISVSTHCTRCGTSPFYSHRAGCAERQVAILGIRPEPA
jgi:polyphenol oxidase